MRVPMKGLYRVPDSWRKFLRLGLDWLKPRVPPCRVPRAASGPASGRGREGPCHRVPPPETPNPLILLVCRWIVNPTGHRNGPARGH